MYGDIISLPDAPAISRSPEKLPSGPVHRYPKAAGMVKNAQQFLWPQIILMKPI